MGTEELGRSPGIFSPMGGEREGGGSGGGVARRLAILPRTLTASLCLRGSFGPKCQKSCHVVVEIGMLKRLRLKMWTFTPSQEA